MPDKILNDDWSEYDNKKKKRETGFSFPAKNHGKLINWFPKSKESTHKNQ